MRIVCGQIIVFVGMIMGMMTQAFSQNLKTNVSQKVYGLVVHGGAGAPPKGQAAPEAEKLCHDKIQEALNAGYGVLATNGAAVDAVIAAVKVLEDSGLFDAGRGAVFNTEGICELDAAVMNGGTLAAGAVAGLQHVKNPIVLASVVSQKSPHVLLIGEGAEKFAREHGFELVPNAYFQTDRRRKQWEQFKKGRGNSHEAGDPPVIGSGSIGTVGCVALDQNGNLAAGTSTGGTTGKLPGRVGDSPIIGAGTYANNATCAVSATGTGEYFIRAVFAHTVSTLMEYRDLSLEKAATEAMSEIQRLGGRGGCIAMDREGNVVMPFNTPSMYRGLKLSSGRNDVQLYGPKQ